MKNRQGLTIAALIIAIIGLSIGFAAFSNTLTISSTATVNPDASNLKVVFANNTDVNNLNTNPVQVFSASTGASGTPGTINNEAQNGPALTGLKASFTEPGQSVVYKLNVVNAGKLKAYLTDIVFGTTGNPAKTVSCTVATKDSNNQDIPAANQATDSLVQSACNGISISVKIGELDAKTASGSLNNLELNVAGYKEVIITISYASGSAYVDGPMNVAFGDIEINAASVGAQSQGGGEQPTPVTSDFVSYEQGVVSDYIGTETSIEIPSSLPVSTPSSATFNIEKCREAYESSECTEMKNAIDNISTIEGKMSYEYGHDSVVDFLDITYTASGTSYPITQIGEEALYNKGLTNVVIPNGITTIGDVAFKRNSLTNVTIPSSVTTIGDNAFSENSLTNVTIPSSVTTIGDNAFSNNSLTNVTISNGVTLIGREAFINNYLTSVSIPNSVTTIGSDAFDKNSLTTVNIGNGITSIGSGAFYSSAKDGYGPNALTSVTINVACDTYKTSFTNVNQFGWANMHTNDDIVWGTACTN